MTDLYGLLKEYEASDFYPFHMPGHKRRKEAAEGALAEVYGIDITEIDGFDNLHQAQGILREQQRRAAEIYDSEETRFLINGSTGGILSAVAAVAGKGSRLLMARNCHKAVYHAVYLQELKTAFLRQKVTEPYGITDAVSPESVRQALEEMPDIAAVIITSPTYEGVVSDIKKIAGIVHSYGKPLIVDEAHGAHFGFHGGYPESSVRQGADIVIHSVHKTLPSMTQTALLHVNGELVDRERLRRYLRIFQTSSPSYVLMASVSQCMTFMEREGRERLEQLLVLRQEFLERIRRCVHIKAADHTEPCKLVLYLTNDVMTGQQLYDILRDDYHLQMEMAAGSYVLAILTLMDTKEGIRRLADAVLEIENRIAAGLRENEAESRETKADTVLQKNGGNPPVCEAALTIAEAYEKEAEVISLSKAEGRVAAEFINLYPPGIPLVVPGEKWNRDMIRSMECYETMGLNVQGIDGHKIRVVK